MFAFRASNETRQYMKDGIRYVCENFKNRAPGSKSERDAQAYFKTELEKYADELLYRCEAMMSDPLRKKEFRRSAEVFRLEEPLNRCSVDQKTSEQIKSNHTRWKKIAQAAGKIR